MKKLLLFIFLISTFTEVFGQVSSDVAVLVNATVAESPASITLHWPLYIDAAGYSIYKKPLGANAWGAAVANPLITDTTYTDTNVTVDSLYEYKIVKSSALGNAYGYILSGIKRHADDVHGYIVMMVDSSIADSLSNELHQMMIDFSNDGWAVLRHDISSNTSPPNVRAMIVDDYNNYSDVNAVILIGHIAVPYSGHLNPDGHPDHLGAWPADAYYGDMDGTWTDNVVNDSSASRPENQNRIGDGKFDQTMIPGYVELQVGRIDLHNMPSFPKTEIELLRQYLNKDHAFKTKMFSPVVRGLVDDNFGYFGGEAFASSGWRSIAPLVGNNNVSELDLITTCTDSNYLWSYGCGGGWFQGAGGVGTSYDWAADSLQTVFTELFGSYFGDWDSQDNFLRSPLASKSPSLTCVWSGRPYWQFHPMAMGKNIGYCAKLTQNNTNTYWSNYAEHWVHIALMGDPTLRETMITPPTQVHVDSMGVSFQISWTPSSDSVLGYYVYRSNEEFGVYQRISPVIIINNAFFDSTPLFGNNFYQVRAVALQTGFSGNYYNTSLGERDSVPGFFNGINSVTQQNQIQLWPNPSTGTLSFQLPQTGLQNNISITNLQGQLVYQSTMVSSLSMQTLHLENLPAGIYVLQVCNAKGCKQQKFIITK